MAVQVTVKVRRSESQQFVFLLKCVQYFQPCCLGEAEVNSFSFLVVLIVCHPGRRWRCCVTVGKIEVITVQSDVGVNVHTVACEQQSLHQ